MKNVLSVPGAGGAGPRPSGGTRRARDLVQRQSSEEGFRMAVTSIKEQLQRTLAYEKVILQFYRELGERLTGSDMGQVCREAAAAAQDRVNQLSAWLDCRV
jgi:rubrerythrin